MRVTVEKLTDASLAARACWFTSRKSTKDPDALLRNIYTAEHSPMRTQIFWVEMFDIPTFVSVHFRTHSSGITHFVESNREDKGVKGKEVDRWTPVRHAMILNAQSLINLARKRLCHLASHETQNLMLLVRRTVLDVDTPLWKLMVPDCVYRGKCVEINSCGLYEGV